MKQTLLLQICCATCGGYISSELIKEFSLTLYFCNPNLFPAKEWEKRLADVKALAAELQVALIIDKQDYENWKQTKAGLENEPEKGKRCVICYNERLAKTAQLARQKDFAHFGTTLTTSPYKDGETILSLGRKLQTELGLLGQAGVKFLDRDFKKDNGWQKAIAWSKEHNYYRQKFCGCEFSLIKN